MNFKMKCFLTLGCTVPLIAPLFVVISCSESQQLEDKVQRLTPSNLKADLERIKDFGLIKDKKPSEVKKSHIKKIKGLENLKDADITLAPKDKEGKLKITIKNHGKDKSVEISGFKKSEVVTSPTISQSPKVSHTKTVATKTTSKQ